MTSVCTNIQHCNNSNGSNIPNNNIQSFLISIYELAKRNNVRISNIVVTTHLAVQYHDTKQHINNLFNFYFVRYNIHRFKTFSSLFQWYCCIPILLSTLYHFVVFHPLSILSYTHTGSVLSTNSPHLSPHLTLISQSYHVLQYTHHHLIWHMFPLYSSSFCVCVAIKLPPLSVYTPRIYTIRFDLQLIGRRKCAALINATYPINLVHQHAIQ